MEKSCFVLITVRQGADDPAPTTRELGKFHTVWQEGITIGSSSNCRVVLPDLLPLAATLKAASNHIVLEVPGSRPRRVDEREFELERYLISCSTIYREPVIANSQDENQPSSLEQSTIDFRSDVSLMGHQRPDSLGRFGGYELLAVIARGGMGVVYKARQIEADRIVALKLILSGQIANKDEVRRFQIEARAAATLDHPNIVPVFDVGMVGNQHYYTMAYVNGSSLKSHLAEGPLLPNRAAEIVETVARATAYAHEHGVIHRDLKPANILIDEAGNPRVADFGLAKRIDGDIEVTSTGQVLGTPSYMPPEQASGNLDEIGPASDVYGLGAVLYTLLVGRPPFQAASSIDTLLQVLHEEPVSPRALNTTVDRDLDTICLKCLQKDPTSRYPSAIELAEDLFAYQQGRPIKARPISKVAIVWRWCRRNPTIATLFGLVFLSAAALFVSNAGDAIVGIARRAGNALVTPRRTANNLHQLELALDEFRRGQQEAADRHINRVQFTLDEIQQLVVGFDNLTADPRLDMQLAIIEALQSHYEAILSGPRGVPKLEEARRGAEARLVELRRMHEQLSHSASMK